MRTLVVLVAIALLLSSNVFAQGGTSFSPGLAYRFTIPPDPELPIQTSAIGEIAAHYLVPVTLDGEWNLEVIGGIGLSNDLTGTMIGIGTAYAPIEVPNIIVGLAFVFDVTFPTDAFIDKTLTEYSDEAWLSFGIEGKLDFKVGSMPGALLAGWTNAIRDKPNMAYFAFQIPMGPEDPEARIKRAD
jgi:hypothetical protein